MSRTDSAGASPPAPSRLDRPVLVSNLMAGACLLGVLASLSWPLAVMGAVYVAAASVFLAACYAHVAPTWRQEAAVWAAPWLAAVALWTWVAASLGTGASSPLLTVWVGVVIATPCYLGWQAAALAVRRALTWGAGSTSA